MLRRNGIQLHIAFSLEMLVYGEESETTRALMTINMGARYNLKIKPTDKNNSSVQLNLSETAQYIADMLLELRNMAKAANLKAPQGILELGYYEAHRTAHHIPVPEGEAERLEQMGADARAAEAS